MVEVKKPNAISMAREKAVKYPYILEHNIEGAKFRDGKISKAEWIAFQEDWEGRLQVALHNAVEQRIYTVEVS